MRDGWGVGVVEVRVFFAAVGRTGHFGDGIEGAGRLWWGFGEGNGNVLELGGWVLCGVEWNLEGWVGLKTA